MKQTDSIFCINSNGELCLKVLPHITIKGVYEAGNEVYLHY